MQIGTRSSRDKTIKRSTFGLRRSKINVMRNRRFQQLASVRMEELSIGGAAVAPVDTARDLGVTLDAQLTLDKHVDSVVRSCFYQLRQLCSIRRSLTGDALLTLVHAFITSRVDYCNAVLYGVAGYVLRRLQSVLNAAARLITGVEHITPTLRDTLHWLPVPQRGNIKQCEIDYCALVCHIFAHTTTPQKKLGKGIGVFSITNSKELNI